MSLMPETEEQTVAATGMANPQLKFISLVENPANREAARTIKSESEGGNNVSGGYVQKILAPKDTDALAVLTASGIDDYDEFMQAAVKSESETFTIYSAKKSEAVDPATIRVAPILDAQGENTGLCAVVGNALKSEAKKAAGPADVEVVTGVTKTWDGYRLTTETIANAVDTELWRVMNASWNIMMVKEMSNKARLNAIIAMLKGAAVFVKQMFELMDEDTAQKSEAVTMPKLEGMITALKGETEDMKPEDMEAITTAISNSVGTAVADAMKAQKTAEAEEAEAKKAEENKTRLSDLETKVAGMVTELDTVKTENSDLKSKLEAAETAKSEAEAKVAELEASPETVRGDGTPVVGDVQKNEGGLADDSYGLIFAPV